jgi:hypothetical protein
MRSSDRPALDRGYRHLAESVLDVVRKETFGGDSGLTVEEYESFLGWIRLALEQHVHELAGGLRR